LLYVAHECEWKGRGSELSDGTVDHKRKKRGWKWWLGVLVVLGILSSNDNDGSRCSVGDDAFILAIGRAVGQWKIEDFALYLINVTSTRTDPEGTVQFLASVGGENGWTGTAQGSVRLRKCKASVDKVQ
jgi:hypothetical protein